MSFRHKFSAIRFTSTLPNEVQREGEGEGGGGLRVTRDGTGTCNIVRSFIPQNSDVSFDGNRLRDYLQ